jgi:hypothetical protein
MNQTANKPRNCSMDSHQENRTGGLFPTLSNARVNPIVTITTKPTPIDAGLAAAAPQKACST